MKDLQFGTLYKFFVSFGTLLMSAPVVLVGFIINAVATGTVLKDLILEKLVNKFVFYFNIYFVYMFLCWYNLVNYWH